MDYEIQLDIDDIISMCSKREKKELWKALLEDDDLLTAEERRKAELEEKRQEEFMLMERLQSMSRYELKQTLCNLLNVCNYTDEQGLRTALEPIIKA